MGQPTSTYEKDTTESLVMQGISSTWVEREMKSIKEEYRMVTPYDEMIEFETMNYLEGMDKDNPPFPGTVKREILECINSAIDTHNKGPEDPPGSGEYPHPMKGDDKYKKLKTLPVRQVALILIHRHRVRRINVGRAGDKNYALGMYVTDGADEGIYDLDEDKICALVSDYNTIDDYRNWKAVLEGVRIVFWTVLDYRLVVVSVLFYGYSAEG